ncbi:unnamed protein product [Spodoptera exigua]|nr:unnamed protein product [Spodoptera exigua]
MATETLIPLESNPDVMNKFLQKLGVPSQWSIVDVMGLEPEMLSWVPRPVLSVMLLFPITDAYEEHKQKEESDILSKGQEVSNNIFYMKKFLDEAKDMDAPARGKLLEKSDGIIQAHKELAQEGQTNTPSAEDPVNHHFITFVHKDGFLYELDGRKAFPINHGPTTPDSLLEDSAKICKAFMARDPNEVRFTVIALAASD